MAWYIVRMRRATVVISGSIRKLSASAAMIGVPVVLFLAIMASWVQLQPMEAMTVDFRMRLRLHLVPESKRTDTQDLVLLAIDHPTEDALGRYGAGRWLSRSPFLDHLRFFRSYCRPSVLAYDVIFKDTQGAHMRQAERISEAPVRKGRIASALAELASGSVDCVSDAVLSDLSQLTLEQGDIALAHGLAGVWEDSHFPSVLGFNFRGGWVDPQNVEIPAWSADDGGSGLGASYLKDIAIPDSCIHFDSTAARSRYESSPNANLPSPDLWDYAYLGALNIPRDVDGVVRRVPLVVGFALPTASEGEAQQVFVPSLALLSVLLHLGIDTFPLTEGVLDVHFGEEIVVRAGEESFRIPIDAFGCMQLNYRWSLRDFASVSFVTFAPAQDETTTRVRRALASQWAGLIRDRIAVVGVTVTGLDVGTTPISANTPLVFAQLTAINDILTRSFLLPVSPLIAWGSMLGLLIAFVVLCRFVRSARVVLGALLLLLAYLVAAYGGVHVGIIALPVVAPVLFVVTASFWVLTFRYLIESRDRRRIRGMFSTMVSGTVLSFLEDHPESFSLEGHTTHASILFTDIADFTSLSEHLPPAKIIRLLNTYLAPVTDNVLQRGGYLDKYSGDGLMAVWGAPYADEAHALKACLSALDQKRLLRQLNDEIESEYGFRLRVRIGVNSGEVTAGNMGSERKFQYTVLGDPVNLASRLEPVNRDFGTEILVGESTQRLISAQLETREICRILVPGREQVVTVYELLGKREELDDAALRLQSQYARALESFYAGKWSRCERELEEILSTTDDGPSACLLAWARQYEKHPPPQSGKGVFIRTGKKAEF
jgi:adenylate cyclase